MPTTAATITATSKSDTTKTATATVTFTPVAISLSPTTATLIASATQTFTVSITGDTALNSGATWSVSPSVGVGVINPNNSTAVYSAPSVVTVTTVTVTATSKTDPSKSASATVTLTPIAVSITTTPVAMVAGATQTFAATVSNDITPSAGVTWSASVGTITAGGVYTAPTPIATATATITATSKTDPTKTNTATVTLTPISVAITTTPVAMVAGATQTFAATVSNDITPSAGVTWTASVGSITALGVYTAPTPVPTTAATITATSKTDITKTNTATVTFTPIAVSVSPTTATLIGGATQTFTPTVTGDTTLNAGVTWTATTGSITALGVYTAPAVIGSALSATVTATSKTDTTKTGTATVTLTPISLAAINPATASLGSSGSQAFTDTAANDGSSLGVSWSIGSGAGTLTASSSTGVTYNAPTTAISSVTTVTLTATSIKDNTKTTTATITLNPVSVAVSPTTATMVAGQTQTFTPTVSNDGATPGVTWTASVGSITAGGVYTAPTPVPSGTTSATITATSKTDTTKTATATVTLTPVAVSVSPTTATVIGGASTTIVATVTGDTALNKGVTWTVSSGPGTITAGGAYTAPAVIGSITSATVTATSVTDSSKSASAIITLSPIGITFTTVTTGVTLDSGQTLPLTAAVANDGSALGATFAATGAGIVSPSSATGNAPVTTLTATGTTTSSVTVTATGIKDTTKSVTTSSITVNPVLAINTAAGALPAGMTGSVYAGTIIAISGGTGTKTFVATGLPTGLAISNAGAISGTPTATAGTYSFTVKVTDSATTPFSVTSGTYTITIAPAPLVWVSPTGGTQTFTASSTAITPINLTTTGGTGTITYTVNTGSLPTGLSISGSQVVDTASQPTVVGGDAVTFLATDSATPTHVTAISASVTIIVNPVILVVNSPTLPTGFVNSAYNGTGYQFLATGGTGAITWTMSPANVASGMTLSTTGMLSGTPTATYSSTISVTATDSATNQQQTKNITPSLTVSNALTVTTGQSSLPIAYTSQSYSTTLAASGGSGSGFTWTVTSGLTGTNSLATLNLSVNGSTGAITGTPSAAGTATFTVQVADNASHTALATFSITAYAPLTLTAPSASVPGPGTVNAAYTASIAALGGVPAYTYTVNGSVLTTSASVSLGDGLSITNSGGTVLNITGTPTATNSGITFTVKVTDTASNPVGPNTYTIVVNNPLTITTTNSGLPYAYVNQAYTPTTLAATGGTGSYTWSVTLGLTGNNSLQTLNLAVSPTGVITGTPATAGLASFNVQVADTASHTATASYAITAYTPLSIPATNPSTLGPATTTGSYTGSITVTGGVPAYTWTVNGSTNSSVSLNNGTLSASVNNNTLNITGTPSTTGTVSFTVSVKDTAGTTTSTITYTIAVSTTYNIGGTITNNNNCGTTIPTILLSLTQGTNSIQKQTTDSNGNFTFTGIANGIYTITPTIAGPTSVFYPATQSVTVNSGDITTANFSVALGYNVSGTVSYTGLQTGQIYLSLTNSSCYNDGLLGTSISPKGAYTIHGVPPGTYTLNAFMDTLGKGAPNASNPSGGTSSSSVSVTTANVSGADVTLTDPATVTLSTSAPVLQGGGGFNIGALISYKAIATTDTNGNSTETATSYTLQWSTSANFSSVAGSKTFPAVGPDGVGVWMLNTTSSSSLTSGGAFYFRAFGTSGGTTQGSYSNVLGPFTISAPNPTGGNTVSGAVTFTGTAAGPLGVGFFNQSTGNFYGEGFLNPVSAQAYSIQVPTGAGYYFVGVLDQNNDGTIDAGDITDFASSKRPPLATITGATPNQNLTLPTGSATALVTTAGTNSGSNTSYALGFEVNGLLKLPVAVSLSSSTNADGANVITPMDISLCASANNNSCGGSNGFVYYVNNVVPAVGDAYTFAVTYSDTTTGNVTATVAGVMNAFATLVSPTVTSSTDTPTFTWTDPTSASNYIYQFSLYPQGGGNTIWEIPHDNGTLTSSTTSIPWITSGNDVTGNPNVPKVSSLTSGTGYTWQITVVDTYGNSDTTQTNFTAP